MSVEYVRDDLKVMLPIYQLIDDCIDGELSVKARGQDYLPKPCPEDNSAENNARYEAYKTRAVFYNVTGRTLEGLVGEIFSRDPVIEIPTSLKNVIVDINGDGIDIVQSAKKACKYNTANGRAGLLVDFPVVSAPISLIDKERGIYNPTVNLYSPKKIINWRTKTTGSKIVLSLVVLQEEVSVYDDGFERQTETQYRVLRLGKDKSNNIQGLIDNPNVYTVEIWRNDKGARNSIIFESYQPRNNKGAFLTEIPFFFIGAENNDSDIDNPPLYSMASLNIAHYRNSADYEESSFLVGQPTYYITGLDERWLDEKLNGIIQIGSRGGIPLPQDATAGILQPEPNIMPKEAMEQKERQMAALGARIVEQKTVQRTATEASIESNTEKSTLSTIAKNVSSAYKKALEACLQFVGNESTEIKFELNSDFNLANLSFDEIMKVINMWNQGAISFDEMRRHERLAGLKLDDDKIAIQSIEGEKQAEIKRQLQLKPINSVNQK